MGTTVKTQRVIRFPRLFASVLFLAIAASTAGPAFGQWGYKRGDSCLQALREISGNFPRAAVFGVQYTLKRQKCQGVLPLLEQWYRDNQVLYRDEILEILEHLWQEPFPYPDREEDFKMVRPIYLKLVKDALTRSSTAAQGAHLVKQWQLAKELQSELARLLQKADSAKAQGFASAFSSALEALDSAAAVTKDLVPNEVLIALLHLNPKTQGIETNRLAARHLGRRGCSQPEAIKGLVKLLLLETLEKEKSDAAFEALLAIGPAVVPFLVDAVVSRPGEEDAGYLTDFAQTRHVRQWRRLVTGDVPLLLGLLGDSKGVRAVVADLARPIPTRPMGSHYHSSDWNDVQRRRIECNSQALTSLFDSSVALDSLRIMRRSDAEPEIRLKTAKALAFAFTPEATKTLFQLLQDDAATKSAVEQRTLPPVSRKGEFIARAMPSIAMAVDHRGVAGFLALFVDNFEAHFGQLHDWRYVKYKLVEADIKVPLAVPAACQDNFACYLNVLEGRAGTSKGASQRFAPEELATQTKESVAHVRTLAMTKGALVLGRWSLNKKQQGRVLELLEQHYAQLPFEPRHSRYRHEEADASDRAAWTTQAEDLRLAVVLGLERIGLRNPEAVLPVVRRLLKSHNDKLPSAGVWKQRLEALHLLLERQ